jgi:hypothetical protein
MSALADAWWAAADAAKEDPAGPRRARAAHWYAAALPGLTGIRKTAAETRIAASTAAASPSSTPLRSPNLLAKMQPQPGLKVERVGDAVRITGAKNQLVTPGSYKPPMEVEVVASTDSTNLRVYFADCHVIFNWEGNQTQLRFHGPPGGKGTAVDDQGAIPKNTMVTVVCRLTETTATILVDGKERAKVERDFSASTGPVAVSPAAGSIVTIKSVRVTGSPAGN